MYQIIALYTLNSHVICYYLNKAGEKKNKKKQKGKREIGW